jgi:TPR repeat protein
MRAIVVLGAVLLGGLNAYAGGELEKPKAYYIEACDNKRSAEACEIMAEQTVCGRGYNKDTASFMKKACGHHAYHCKQGDGPGCLSHAECILSCLSWETYWSSPFSAADETSGCHLDLKLTGETKEQLNQAGVKRALAAATRACDANDPKGCGLLGWLSATAEIGQMNQAKQAWQKSCDLESTAGCLALSEQLMKEAKVLTKRACELGDRSACPEK